MHWYLSKTKISRTPYIRKDGICFNNGTISSIVLSSSTSEREQSSLRYFLFFIGHSILQIFTQKLNPSKFKMFDKNTFYQKVKFDSFRFGLHIYFFMHIIFLSFFYYLCIPFLHLEVVSWSFVKPYKLLNNQMISTTLPSWMLAINLLLTCI